MTTPSPAPRPGTPSPGGYGVIPLDPYTPDDYSTPSEFGKLPKCKRVTDNKLGLSPRHGRKARTGNPGTQLRG